MVSEQQLEYIKQKRNSGFSDENIKTELRSAGYSDELLTELFQKLDGTHIPESQNKKGFFAQYWWVLLIVGFVFIGVAAFIGIGAIAYFGVLQPDNFIPERCIASTGFTCANFAYDKSSNEISLSIVNGPSEMTLDTTSITFIETNNRCSIQAPETTEKTLMPHEQFTISAKCSNINNNERLQATIKGNFKNPSQELSRPFEVELSINVK